MGNLKERKSGRGSCKDSGPGERDMYRDVRPERGIYRPRLQGWIWGRVGVGHGPYRGQGWNPEA